MLVFDVAAVFRAVAEQNALNFLRSVLTLRQVQRNRNRPGTPLQTKLLKPSLTVFCPLGECNNLPPRDRAPQNWLQQPQVRKQSRFPRHHRAILAVLNSIVMKTYHFAHDPATLLQDVVCAGYICRSDLNNSN